jgi:hypothetical protein
LENERVDQIAQNVICLWYDHAAEEAARYYASVLPDSSVGAVHRAPSDYLKRFGPACARTPNSRVRATMSSLLR